MTTRNFTPRRPRAASVSLALLAAVAALAGIAPALAQDALGHVISSQPIMVGGQTTGYQVTYEYNGQQYTTRTDQPPGPTIAVQRNAYGVTTTPVAPQPVLAPRTATGPTAAANGAAPWEGVRPEPGVVVSADGTPAGVAPAAPMVMPPVYVAPAYAYPYAYPAVYPYAPVSVSLGIGYVGGWGGWHGGWGGGWRRGWR